MTYDEPLRYQRRLVRGEFSRRFATTEELRPIDVAIGFPPIGYLSAPVRRAMGWDTPDQRPLDGGGPDLQPDVPRSRGWPTDNPYLSIRPATKAPS